MRPFASRLITIGLVAAIAVVGSLAGRAVWESVTAEDVPKAEPPPLSVVNEENAKPDFAGEILGVFIGPAEKVPDKFVTYQELCGPNPTEQVSWDKVGEFDFAASLPPSYKLDSGSLNTGVISCGDVVYAARWDYQVPQPNGYPGRLLIARSLLKDAQFDASADRVKATEIGGLPAVYIEPLSPNGVSSSAGLVFPGEPVITLVYSTGIPADDLLKVGEIIAAAIQKGG